MAFFPTSRILPHATTIGQRPLGTATKRAIAADLGAIDFAMNNYAGRITQHMQSHAIWKNRTGNARRSLRARLITERPSGKLSRRYYLVLEYDPAYAIYYAKYLEHMRGGHFAIVNPTADVYGPRISRRLRALTRRGPISPIPD
jgi:hypothetical protein